MEEQMYSINEAAKYLGIMPSSLRALAARNVIPSQKYRAKRHFKQSDLDSYKGVRDARWGAKERVRKMMESLNWNRPAHIDEVDWLLLRAYSRVGVSFEDVAATQEITAEAIRQRVHRVLTLLEKPL